MAGIMYLPWLLTCAYLICSITGQDSIVSVIQRLDEFYKEMLANKVDMIRMEKRIINCIDVAKTSLTAELKENIRDEVRKAMTEILQGEFLQDMMKSHIVSELQHVKKGYHQMRRQFHYVSRSLRDFKDETTVFHESIIKKVDLWKQGNSSDTCIRDINRLETEMQKRDATIARLKTDIVRCTTLKETCQLKVSKLISNVTVSPFIPTSPNLTSTPRPSVSTTTPRPEEAKSRILIAPMRSATPHQFRQLNIQSNSLSVYPYHTMKKVTTFAYIAKTKKLLIGLSYPNKIVSSTLDTRHMTVLRENVWTYGMAVDEDRDIVFMSTSEPRYSIRRMSTQGKDFTAIIVLSGYGNPMQITLDTKRRRIYGCNGGKLFTVTYDGQGLTTLATGSKMYAVTLDQTAGVLYYSIRKNLMKMTRSNNVSTEVTALEAVPWNMRLYRGTIYYSGYSAPIVGAVDVTYNTVVYTLQSVSMKRARIYCMCLIP